MVGCFHTYVFGYLLTIDTIKNSHHIPIPYSHDFEEVMELVITNGLM